MQNMIDRHLRDCAECRLDYRRLSDAVVKSAAAGVCPLPAANPEMLSELFASIRAWEAERTNPENTSHAVTRRVAGALEAYLGVSGTKAVLGRVSSDSRNLLSVVESVLQLFLGRRAATLLVNHIIDTAIVRI